LSYKVIDFSFYSSIKIGSPLSVEVLEEEVSRGDRFIVGGANNIIVSPNASNLAILSKKYDFIEIKDAYLHIGGATPSGRIFSFAKRNGIRGFEILAKLPGKLGGLLKMNAGLKGDEISSALLGVKLGGRGFVEKCELGFGYRSSLIDDVVYKAIFEIKEGFSEELVEGYKAMRQNQPSDPSVGSCFKNPAGDYAGRLLEAAGLKGYSIGGAAFSEKHANFLINRGGASFEDAKNLIATAKKRVFEEFGVELENEVILV